MQRRALRCRDTEHCVECGYNIANIALSLIRNQFDAVEGLEGSRHTSVSRSCQNLFMVLQNVAVVSFHVRLVSFAQSIVLANVGIKLIPYHKVSSCV